MADHRSARGSHPSLAARPTDQTTNVRLVFGPAADLPALLEAAANALDPFDVVPSGLVYSEDRDGYRLRVSLELDPSETDVRRFFARLVPAPACPRPATAASRPRRILG
ncbi:MAG: hypothetical protein ABW073_02180 [Acidimicrobiia bacterium]